MEASSQAARRRRSAPARQCRRPISGRPTLKAAAMADPALVEATGIHTFYGASHILHDVALTVRRGETVALMGRNGMGKTTLLRSILGLTRPRHGAVRINGADMTAAPPHAVARRGIAFVPEGR